MLVNLHWPVPFNAADFHFSSCCPRIWLGSRVPAASGAAGRRHFLFIFVIARWFSCTSACYSNHFSRLFYTFPIDFIDDLRHLLLRRKRHMRLSAAPKSHLLILFFFIFSKKTCVCCSRTFFGNNFSFLVLNAKESDRMYNFLQFSFTQIICHFQN